MASRRRSGNALAAGVNVLSGAVQADIQRQFDAESEGRKFRQKLVELGITKEYLQPIFDARGQLTGIGPGPRAPEQAFEPMARQQLGQTLPQGPFVSGPYGEGVITGSSVESLPGDSFGRAQAIQSQALQLAPQLKARAQTQAPGLLQPVFERTRDGQLRQVGTIPKGARILNPLREDESSVGFPETVESQVGGGGQGSDPIVKTGVDESGRRVGKTRSGRVVYLE